MPRFFDGWAAFSKGSNTRCQVITVALLHYILRYPQTGLFVILPRVHWKSLAFGRLDGTPKYGKLIFFIYRMRGTIDCIRPRHTQRLIHTIVQCVVIEVGYQT